MDFRPGEEQAGMRTSHQPGGERQGRAPRHFTDASLCPHEAAPMTRLKTTQNSHTIALAAPR